MNPVLLFVVVVAVVVVVVILPPATASDPSVPALRSAFPSIGRKVGFCKSFASSAKAAESDDGSGTCTGATLRSCDDESFRVGESPCVSKVLSTSGEISGYCAVGKLDCSSGEDFNPKENAPASTRWWLLDSPSPLREDPSDEQKQQYSTVSKEQSLPLPEISGRNIAFFLALLGIAISVGYGIWLVGTTRYRLGRYQFWYRVADALFNCVEFVTWVFLLAAERFPFLRSQNWLLFPAIVALFQMRR